MARSPREKKQLDYDHQRRGFSEYAHAMRHGKWRKKRRSVQRAERGAVAVLLGKAAQRSRDSDVAEVDLGGVTAAFTEMDQGST
jgi:hypothetical protein